MKATGTGNPRMSSVKTCYIKAGVSSFKCTTGRHSAIWTAKGSKPCKASHLDSQEKSFTMNKGGKNGDASTKLDTNIFYTVNLTP